MSYAKPHWEHLHISRSLYLSISLCLYVCLWVSLYLSIYLAIKSRSNCLYLVNLSTYLLTNLENYLSVYAHICTCPLYIYIYRHVASRPSVVRLQGWPQKKADGTTQALSSILCRLGSTLGTAWTRWWMSCTCCRLGA